MIGVILVGILLAAVVVCLCVLVRILYHRGDAAGPVYFKEGADADSGRIGTGSCEFAKQPYATIVVKDGKPEPTRSLWQVALRDTATGQMSSFTFTDSVVLGRGIPGQTTNGVVGMGADNSISRQQCVLRANGNCLYVQNISKTVPLICNNAPVNQPMPIQSGCLLQAGRAGIYISQIGQTNT